MNATTAYDRKIRRRNVIRLRSQGMNYSEIAEELCVSESTIKRDMDRINSELSKLDDPSVLAKQLKQGAKVLLEEEYDDLRSADRENDEKAKHRAKSSFRQTLEFMKKINEDIEVDSSDDTEDWLDDINPELRDELMDAAGQVAEEIITG